MDDKEHLQEKDSQLLALQQQLRREAEQRVLEKNYRADGAL